MDPAGLIPSPDAIPVHWGWFQALLTITFALHILFMNTMLGSSIIALVREFRTTTDPDPVSQDISLKLPYTIAFTVNLGVAPLLFLQVLYGQFVYTSSILMAVYWLSVVALVIGAYYSAYLYDFKFESLGQGRRIFIAISVVLMLTVAFFFTNNMTMMLRPASWTRYFTNPSGTLLNLGDPMLIPRYLHFVTASVAVGGLFQALVWTWKEKRGSLHATVPVTSGLTWFMAATGIQMGWGLWFLIALPPGTRELFLGASPLHTGLLITGICCASLALFAAAKHRIWLTVWLFLGTIAAMIPMRELVRADLLKPYFSPADLTVTSEYSPLILFLVSFAAGLALIAYMLKLAADAQKEVAE